MDAYLIMYSLLVNCVWLQCTINITKIMIIVDISILLIITNYYMIQLNTHCEYIISVN